MTMQASTVGATGRRAFAAPGFSLKIVILLMLSVLIVAPLLRVVGETLTLASIGAWTDVIWGRLAPNLLWRPLGNTLVLGLGAAGGCVLIGGFLAWLVTMTDVPMRRVLGVMATLPFMIPSFATALAWGALFRNGRVGGQIGFLQAMGMDVPDWLSWGMSPSLLVLVAHYYSLAFAVIAAALATVNSDLIEAAQLTGAPRRKVLAGIVLPVVMPAIIAGASLAFAGAASNFAVPALLGLPVRMQTLATRLYGMIEIGQTARGYVIAILLILVSAFFLWLGNRVAIRPAFLCHDHRQGRTGETLPARRGARGRCSRSAMMICILTTVVPILVLIASSLAPVVIRALAELDTALLDRRLNPHDRAGPGRHRAQSRHPRRHRRHGRRRADRCPDHHHGRHCDRVRPGAAWNGRPWRAINQLAFLPLLMPGIAFGAAYIALFGAPIGPVPALYGTITLLVLAATAYLMPFAVQTGRVGDPAGRRRTR